MKSKLPPLNFDDEKREYDAKEEVKEINFKKCPHKQAKLNNGELRCPCGAAWVGPNLHQLYEGLTGVK